MRSTGVPGVTVIYHSEGAGTIGKGPSGKFVWQAGQKTSGISRHRMPLGKVMWGGEWLR